MHLHAIRMGGILWVRRDGRFAAVENCGDISIEGRTTGRSCLAVVCDRCNAELLLPEVQGNVSTWSDADSLFDMAGLDGEENPGDFQGDAEPEGGTIVQMSYHGKCPKCGAEMDAEVSVRCDYGSGGDMRSFGVEVTNSRGCRVKEAKEVEGLPIAPMW